MQYDFKMQLRKEMNEIRENISKKDKKNYDRDIFSKVIEDDTYKNAQTIFVYVSFKNEVFTHNIILDALNKGKKVCVPKVISKKQGMKAILIKSFEELGQGKYGILEPTKIEPYVSPEDIDLCIVPGLAFDLKGGRLGYGGGFYDRFLINTSKKTVKLALAYDFQIVKEVHMEDYDVKVDKIITQCS